MNKLLQVCGILLIRGSYLYAAGLTVQADLCVENFTKPEEIHSFQLQDETWECLMREINNSLIAASSHKITAENNGGYAVLQHITQNNNEYEASLRSTLLSYMMETYEYLQAHIQYRYWLEKAKKSHLIQDWMHTVNTGSRVVTDFLRHRAPRWDDGTMNKDIPSSSLLYMMGCAKNFKKTDVCDYATIAAFTVLTFKIHEETGFAYFAQRSFHHPIAKKLFLPNMIMHKHTLSSLFKKRSSNL